VSLAVFDLDDTLLDGDSDPLWGHLLASIGVVDGAAYERENLRYDRQYLAGELDIDEFLNFSLRPLVEHDLATLGRCHAPFMAERIPRTIRSKARAPLERVTHAVAVDPDAVLREAATARGWPIMTLRDTAASPPQTSHGGR